MTRFIHTADWQLGMTQHFLSPEAQGRFAQDRIDAIRRIGEIARAQAAQFVVVCGDVFESNQVERQTVVRALDAIETISVPVYLLPGNHDPLDAVSVFRSASFEARRPDNLFVLTSSEPVVPPGCPNVEIIAAPWSSKRPLCDLVEHACRELSPATGAPGGVTRICVAHGGVDSLAPERGDPALIRLERAEAALREARIHYLALGDRHSVTQVGGTGRIWYSGAPVATDYREVRPGFALCVELGDGPDPPPCVEECPVGSWRFIERHFALDSDDDISALAAWLDADPDKERAIVRLALVGSLTLRGQAMLDSILDGSRDGFASLEIWQRHSELVVLPDTLDRDGLALSGYAQRTWDALVSAAGSAAESTGSQSARDTGNANDTQGGKAADASAPQDEACLAARDALALLYRLARSGAERATA